MRGLLRDRDPLLRACAAEAIGVFLPVFAGPGAVVVDAVSGGGVGSLGVGLAFGLAVMAAIFATGHVSGAHINPAVTLACAAAGAFPAAARARGAASRRRRPSRPARRSR